MHYLKSLKEKRSWLGRLDWIFDPERQSRMNLETTLDDLTLIWAEGLMKEGRQFHDHEHDHTHV